jgi:putative transposase
MLDDPMKYRRTRVAGGTCFFTVNLAERSRTLPVDHVGELRESVRVVRQNHPFVAPAWVVLHEDHVVDFPSAALPSSVRIESAGMQQIPTQRVSDIRMNRGN